MAGFTFIIGWPAIVCYGIQVAGIWFPIGCITALGVLGMTFWGVHKLKNFMGRETGAAIEIWKEISPVLITCVVAFSIDFGGCGGDAGGYDGD